MILFPSLGCLCRDGAHEDDGPSSSGSEQDSRQDANGEGGDRSPAEADYEEPSGDQERELNPYSSMAREDPEEGKPGLMDKVCFIPKAVADRSCASSPILPTGLPGSCNRRAQEGFGAH